jgi:hypothetical protein
MDRGGKTIIGTLSREDIVKLSEDYDLVVVAVGNRDLSSLFPRREDRSPHVTPPRLLSVGLYEGIRPRSDQNSVSITISPGHGEIISGALHTYGNIEQEFILVEAIPGRGLQAVHDVSYQDDPQKFIDNLLGVLEVHDPTLYERIDVSAFKPTSPKNCVTGAFAPTVRTPYADLGNGKFAVAIGDAFVVNDPVVAQGANNASKNAFTLGQLILEHDRFDEAFCKLAEASMWESAQYATALTNAALAAPEPHFIGYFVGSMQNQALADAFVNSFNTPREQWLLRTDPAYVDEFVRTYANVM